MAYDPEDVGSKPTAGNISNLVILQKCPPPCSDNINAHTYSTPLAQRQSARLITWRSADQNPQEVSFFVRLAIATQTVLCRIKIDTYSQTEHSYYQARTTNYTN